MEKAGRVPRRITYVFIENQNQAITLRARKDSQIEDAKRREEKRGKSEGKRTFARRQQSGRGSSHKHRETRWRRECGAVEGKLRSVKTTSTRPIKGENDEPSLPEYR